MQKWGKIYPVGSQYLYELFLDPVSITEKLDGSQINFGKSEYHGLWIRSKNATINFDSVPDLFSPAVAYIQQIADKLPLGYSFHGETLSRNRHNTLRYDRVPDNHVAIYGVITDRGTPLKESEFHDLVKFLGFSIIPILEHNVKINSYEDLTTFLDMESQLGGCNVEGIVVKNYKRSLSLPGREFPILQGKLVSERFKEKHKQNPEFMDPIERIISMYSPEPRWIKAVNTLRESGEDLTVQKIGPLLGIISKDFVDEEKEAIKEELWKAFKKRICSSQLKGFPEWFKEQIEKGDDDGK